MSLMRAFAFAPVLLLVVSCSPPPADESIEGLHTKSWSNWAGNVHCRPQRIAQPTSEAELIAAVKSATHVRVAGAGHSWSALDCADELMISTKSLDRVLAIDDARRTI